MTEKRFQGRGGPFTRYVEICNERAPSATEVHGAMVALRTALWSALRRRGLTQARPSYLGIVGHPTWNRQAVKELAAKAFSYIFVHRMEALQRQLQVKPDLSGLVHKNIGHFLFELQRKHDPIGYRLFDILRGAVRECLDSGALETPKATTRVSADTLLIPQRPGVPSPGFSLASEVATWNDELLTAFVVGRGQRKTAAVNFLCRRLAELPVDRFTLGDVLGPLKTDARQRWSRMISDSKALQSTLEGVTDRTLSDPLADDRFERFVDCVTEWIARDGGDEAQKADLLDLWRIHSAWAGGDLPVGWRGSPERPPSQRRLAEMLGIHRDRVKRLIQILQRFAESCRE
ncbi:MAG: hypothetical protein AAF481_07225 [Acidobacteriota bacterium]